MLVIADIDECALETDSCDDRLVCTFSRTSTYGYYYVIEKNCRRRANCTNTMGSFECTCNEGFEGDGIECNGKYKLLPRLCYLILCSQCGHEQMSMNANMTWTTVCLMLSASIHLEISNAVANMVKLATVLIAVSVLVTFGVVVLVLNGPKEGNLNLVSLKHYPVIYVGAS